MLISQIYAHDDDHGGTGRDLVIEHGTQDDIGYLRGAGALWSIQSGAMTTGYRYNMWGST